MDTLTKPQPNVQSLNGHDTSSSLTMSKYRTLIKQLLSEHAVLENGPGSLLGQDDMETHILFDEERNHYMLFRTGWWRDRRIRTAGLYVRLTNGKIWIEEDRTPEGLATDLLAAGVPNEHIVLAFHHPDIRPFTEFAVA